MVPSELNAICVEEVPANALARKLLNYLGYMKLTDLSDIKIEDLRGYTLLRQSVAVGHARRLARV